MRILVTQAVGMAVSGMGVGVEVQGVCLLIDLAACGLLLQGAFFGTRITYGGYKH